jgi:hypothetical protein
MTVDRRYSAEDIREVIARAKALIGESFDDLVKTFQPGRSSRTPPPHQHRLEEVLFRLGDAAERPGNGFAEGLAAVASVEVSGVVNAMEEWREDPAWPEFRSAIQDPASYLRCDDPLGCQRSWGATSPNGAGRIEFAG